MAENTSPAVRAQRVEADDSLDDFPTPPWATRALVEHVLPRPLFGRSKVWEPCCNRGYMARPLAEYAQSVFPTDVHDYGWAGQAGIADFLFPGTEPPEPVDWVIMNPPFRLGQAFVLRGLQVARRGVAALVRTQFQEGITRYNDIFMSRAPTKIGQFTERVIMTKGVVRDPAVAYFDEKAGKWKKPSTATSYCWLVWVHDAAREPTQWIPPCRRKLERAGDYAQIAA